MIMERDEKQAIEEIVNLFMNIPQHRFPEGFRYRPYVLAEALYNACYRKQEWISVDERLPERFKTVLVYDTHTESVRISLYRGTDEVWRNGRISHWMPFPEPPKLKGDKNEHREAD